MKIVGVKSGGVDVAAEQQVARTEDIGTCGGDEGRGGRGIVLRVGAVCGEEAEGDEAGYGQEG